MHSLLLIIIPLHSLTLGAEASGGASAEAMKPAKPLKRMKMKRDPKKLRMGGGKVWEDHSLDDWDQGKSNLELLI